MGEVELLLNGYDERFLIHILNSYPYDTHSVDLLFSGNQSELYGSLLISPDILSIYTRQEPTKSLPVDLEKKVGLKTEDILAKIISENAGETFERCFNFKYYFENCFNIKTKKNQIEALDWFGMNIFKDYLVFSDFFESIKNASIFCEGLGNYLKNEQLELFNSDFYELYKNTVDLRNVSFVNPESILKGILMKNKFKAYIDEESKTYFYISKEINSVINNLNKPFSV